LNAGGPVARRFAPGRRPQHVLRLKLTGIWS
jgi:hypothetical protein